MIIFLEEQNRLNPQIEIFIIFFVDIIIILYFGQIILINCRFYIFFSVAWDRIFFSILNCIEVYSVYISNHIIVLLLISYAHFSVKMLLTFVVFFSIFFFFYFLLMVHNISSFFDAIIHEVLTRKFYIKTVKKVLFKRKLI